jgi:alpha-tubulin suppressor-like RCC1 family protein
VASAIGLAAGQHHSCATTATNTYCWGLNLYGQYGDGSTTDLSPPGIVTQRVGSTKVDAGIFHTCSFAAGRVKCSGKNDMGEVGDNTVGQQSTAVEVFQGAASIGTGGYTSCAVDVNADLWCWGRNDYKQIDSSQLARRAPTKVLGVIAAQVVAGLNHICAITTNDVATCWGSNFYGQLGDGMTTPSPVPSVTIAVPRVKELAAGPYHTCARDDVGGVWCFGEGYTPVPTRIALARPALSITAGSRHDCAITDDHQIWCWGDQDFGQLGNGVASTSRSAAPQQAKLCP